MDFNSAAPRPSKNKRSKLLGWLALGAAVIVLVVVIIFGATLFTKSNGGSSFGESNINRNQYQAVFLANNQVYFGKIQSITSDGLSIKDIYYLQVQQPVQPGDKKTEDSSQTSLSIAKLGSELHAPEDAMFINRSQVFFWENLKDDGKVVQAIKNNAKK